MTDRNVTLNVRNVSKRFGDFTAVEDLSFEVKAGRVFGFIGPNGAGKTTTIRMIVGITAPDSGSIEYDFPDGKEREDGRSEGDGRGDAGRREGDGRGDGETQGRRESELPVDVEKRAGTPDRPGVSVSRRPGVPPRPGVSHFQDRIGYLPEERGLYKKMKIVDQLRYFAALKGVPGAVADKRIDRWLERMNLAEWKNKKTTDLSKGMQQKIQFISTVLHDPDLLILDEPFSGLDPVNVEFMIDVLSEFKKQDKTVIFSTHLMETAERLCNDILLINKSRKVIAGSLREVKASYGRNLIALRAVGGETVLGDEKLVADLVEHADEMQIELAAGADSQMLLRALLQSGATVNKFENIEPSLNDIFIQNVTGERR